MCAVWRGARGHTRTGQADLSDGKLAAMLDARVGVAQEEREWGGCAGAVAARTVGPPSLPITPLRRHRRTAARSLGARSHSSLTTPYRSQWSVRARAGDAAAGAGPGLLLPTLDWGGSAAVHVPAVTEAMVVPRWGPRRRRLARDVRRSVLDPAAGLPRDASVELVHSPGIGGGDGGMHNRMGGGGGGGGAPVAAPARFVRPRRDGLNAPPAAVESIACIPALTAGLAATVVRGFEVSTVADVDIDYSPRTAAARKVARDMRFARSAVARSRAAAVFRAAAACDGDLAALRYVPAPEDNAVLQPSSLRNPPPPTSGPMRVNGRERFAYAEGVQPVHVVGCAPRARARWRVNGVAPPPPPCAADGPSGSWSRRGVRSPPPPRSTRGTSSGSPARRRPWTLPPPSPQRSRLTRC